MNELQVNSIDPSMGLVCNDVINIYVFTGNWKLISLETGNFHTRNY